MSETSLNRWNESFYNMRCLVMLIISDLMRVFGLRSSSYLNAVVLVTHSTVSRRNGSNINHLFQFVIMLDSRLPETENKI